MTDTSTSPPMASPDLVGPSYLTSDKLPDVGEHSPIPRPDGQARGVSQLNRADHVVCFIRQPCSTNQLLFRSYCFSPSVATTCVPATRP